MDSALYHFYVVNRGICTMVLAIYITFHWGFFYSWDTYKKNMYIDEMNVCISDPICMLHFVPVKLWNNACTMPELFPYVTSLDCKVIILYLHYVLLHIIWKILFLICRVVQRLDLTKSKASVLTSVGCIF